MTMEKQPFEDVSPIKKWRFSIAMLVFRGVDPRIKKPRSIAFKHIFLSKAPTKTIFVYMLVFWTIENCITKNVSMTVWSSSMN